jgi:hypothetical protein
MNSNHQIFEKANMSKRLDIAEVALTLAILNGEPWAIKFMLSTQGKARGYIESTTIKGDTDKPTPIKVEIIAENGRIA